MPIFDTHAHLSDEAFAADRDNIIKKSVDEGVTLILECATSPSDFSAVLSLAAAHPAVYAAIGVHPEYAASADADTLALAESLLSRDKYEKIVAVGEIGLDYHYEPFDKDKQRRLLTAQLAMARRHSLPVSLHCRDATGDMISILSDFAPLRGVMHCFSGSEETAATFLKMGLHIGFGGSSTFKNARRLPAVAAMTPPDRILLETDSPYLAPDPLRGTRNYPGNTAVIAKKLAEYTGLENIAEIAYQNGVRLFGIKQ